ncbi:MAG: NAD(P)-dependent oxidoreductase [Pseudomonadota bacterium]
MARFNRILITGAQGNLGRKLRVGLADLAEHVRIHDRIEMTDVTAKEEPVVSDLGDLEAMLELTKDVDAIVHFGGAPMEMAFEPILNDTIRGTYHIYEGARRNGVKRVIYASSVHAVGFYPLEDNIDASALPRPDGLYGVSKAYVEALSRLYWDKWGIETYCLRIFSSFEQPADRRHLWSFLTFDDLVRAVSAALTAPRVGHTIGFGLSDNTLKPVDDRLAAHIGYHPKDSAEPHRARIQAATSPSDPSAPQHARLGGFIVEMAHPDEWDEQPETPGAKK